MNPDFLEELVRRGDPDRYASALSAEPNQIRSLLVLYGFNLEVARSAWASSDPAICAIRLKWWVDAIGSDRPGHDQAGNFLASSVAELIRSADLPRASFERMIDARQYDLSRRAFSDLDELEEYVDAASGELMALAARALGAPESAIETVKMFAWGSGAAAFLRAVPALGRKGWNALGTDAELVSDIVRLATDRIRSARQNRKKVPRSAIPAMLAGWRASAALEKARSDPLRVRSGRLEESEFRKRATLLARSFTGNW